MEERPPPLTVAEVIQQLSCHEEDALVDFSGLDFHRFKQRGEKLVFAEFNQPVYRTAEGIVVVQNPAEC